MKFIYTTKWVYEDGYWMEWIWHGYWYRKYAKELCLRLPEICSEL